MNKEGKNFKIFGIRPSLIGDSIMSLPILNYLELKYPDSYKYFTIAGKCSQSAPLYLNHPLIDKIYILDKEEGVSDKDKSIINNCDIVFNLFPQHPDGIPCVNCWWWNHYNCVEETWRMAGLPLEEYHKLPKNDKYPKLYRWFKTERLNNTIVIFPFAGYYNENTRNPSINWWNKMVLEINKKFPEKKILHCGYFTEPTLEGKVQKLTNLAYFEQIKLALGADCVIGTDSGTSWVIGAYGHPQVTLLTNHAPKHNQNLLAFAPFNYKNNNINIFATNGCDNINYDTILEAIKNTYE